MICRKCNEKCKCTDSRASLNYGVGSSKLTDESPVKERKYVCKKCNKVYITQEYIAACYYSESKDKRLEPSE